MIGFVALLDCFPGLLGQLIQPDFTLFFFLLYRKKEKDNTKRAAGQLLLTPIPPTRPWPLVILAINHAHPFPSSNVPDPSACSILSCRTIFDPDSSYSFRAAVGRGPSTPSPKHTHTQQSISAFVDNEGHRD